MNRTRREYDEDGESVVRACYNPLQHPSTTEALRIVLRTTPTSGMIVHSIFRKLKELKLRI